MFSINTASNSITLSRGDTGAMVIKASVKRKDNGATYIFGPNDRALFSIKSGSFVLKNKVYPLVHTIMTVNAVARTGTDKPITATINNAVFNAAVDNATGTVTLSYTSDWDSDPEDYGITVTGTPVSGDEIVVTYKKNEFVVVFFNSDTDTLQPGNFSWDVRYVINPYYDEYGNLVDGDQVITPNVPMGMQLLTVVGEI